MKLEIYTILEMQLNDIFFLPLSDKWNENRVKAAIMKYKEEHRKNPQDYKHGSGCKPVLSEEGEGQSDQYEEMFMKVHLLI